MAISSLHTQTLSKLDTGPEMPTCSDVSLYMCSCNHIHAYAASALFLICVECAAVECAAVECTANF